MAQENTNATEGYQMKTGWGTIAMLISATGMGLVPLFSRWATRTDMFDGTLGLNAGDSIGALMACGRMGMGVLFFVILMVATHKVKTFKELKLTPAIALGGLMIGMSLACYVTSTLLTTVANAVLFIYTGPVICVLAARIFRKEPMSGLQWICLLVVFIGMLFGEGLLGFGVGGQFFGLDFSLETSTPEFPQKGVGDAFGLLSGLFYGLSMFYHGSRRVELHLRRAGRWPHHHHPELPGLSARHGELGAVRALHHLQLDRCCAPVDHLRSYRSGLPLGGRPQPAGC